MGYNKDKIDTEQDNVRVCSFCWEIRKKEKGKSCHEYKPNATEL